MPIHSHLRFRHPVWVLMVLALGVWTLPAQAEWIPASGTAAIIGGDVEAAREAALQHAFRDAVERGVGTLVAAETITRNYQVIEDQIFTKARGYVKDWTLRTAYPQGDVYRVEIDCEVSAEHIRDDLVALNILQRAKHNPRVMIVLPATHEALHLHTPTAENTLIRAFVQRDFEVVDQAQVERIRADDAVTAAIAGDDAQAAALGDRFGADVIIIGEAKSVYAAKTFDLRSSTGIVSARALNCDTGKLLGTTRQEATKVHLDDRIAGDRALEAATWAAADDLMAQIVDRWSADVVDALRIQLTLTGVDFDRLQEFKGVLNDVPGVKSIDQLSFVPGAAKLNVDFQGTAERLAESIGAADTDLPLEIVGVTANTVDVRAGEGA